jgi:hypothetical protein
MLKVVLISVHGIIVLPDVSGQHLDAEHICPDNIRTLACHKTH